MRNSWLKLCKYMNYSWFPSRKHSQVLRFFQSHDHTVYSKIGTLWGDLVWKSALHKCEILENLHERLVPQEERYLYMWYNICSHIHVQSQTGLTPIRDFPCPLLHFSQPHWGVFLSLEMEGFWPNVPPGCNRCCMPSHHSWTLPGVDKAYQKTPWQRRRYQVWCGWEHVAECRRPGRLDLFNLFIYYSSVAFYVCIFNIFTWQLHCIFLYLAVMSCSK